MSKVVDITDKLKFEENPSIIIKGKRLEVNADATTMIEVMGEIGETEDITPKSVSKLCNLIFTAKAQRELEKLHLKFDDYTTVVREAIDLITGSDEEDQGE
ncbi:MAG: hypothetical protein SOV36_02550 [Anaerostipes faecalis]|nr:hypothetical protein [Anaerostipes faecalis]